jgi:uncharacterized protein with FMN-binding domain
MKILRSALPLALVLALGACVTPDIDYATPEFSLLPDGAYTGSYDGGLSKAEVRLTLAGGRILKFEVLSLECGLGGPAVAVADRVVAAQSLEVDVVSGASFSSRVILKAAELALTSTP